MWFIPVLRLQSISLLVYLYCGRRQSGPSLILAPLSVVDNWISELARSAVCHIHGPK